MISWALPSKGPSKDTHTLTLAGSNAVQSRRLQKIISGWLIREDLVEGLSFVLALKSRGQVF